MEISIVVPVYNEATNLHEFYKRITKTLRSLNLIYELIFVNDGSKDKSIEIIKKFSRKDRQVKFISFTRNFGQMAAISAGLQHAKGKKIIVMDADLQDPPEVIPKMYKKAKEGYEIVYGTKIKRKEGFIKRTLFELFYKILGNIAQLKMPPNAGTFSIIDNKVARTLVGLPERNKYFSGLRVWTGFSQTSITYERHARLSGKAKPLKSLFSLALNGLVSFSYLPLRVASLFGFFFAFTSFVLIAAVIIGRLVLGWGIVGWASSVSLTLFIGGVQLITLGIIGEYLARIFDEVKARPEFVIREKNVN